MHNGSKEKWDRLVKGRKIIWLQTQCNVNSFTRASASVCPVKWHSELRRDYWFQNDLTAVMQYWEYLIASLSFMYQFDHILYMSQQSHMQVLKIRWLKGQQLQKKPKVSNHKGDQVCSSVLSTLNHLLIYLNIPLEAIKMQLTAMLSRSPLKIRSHQTGVTQTNLCHF